MGKKKERGGKKEKKVTNGVMALLIKKQEFEKERKWPMKAVHGHGMT